jgi:homoserine kinase
VSAATDAGQVHVRVPATSANLGPGFDALGLALSLHDDVIASTSVEPGTRLDVVGEGAHTVPRDESHLVVRAMRATFDRLGTQPTGVVVECVNRIPHGRGLGSSSAAIVAGVLLARALVEGGAEALPGAGVLQLAADLEGHPDNVAACLLGGLCVAWTADGTVEALRVPIELAIRPVALVPPTEASTLAARGLLPSQVPYADATHTAARAALLTAALAGAPGGGGALLAATDDRLHQPYRAASMPESAALVTALRADGAAAVLSGAGPTVLVLARDEAELARVVGGAPPSWRPLPLEVDVRGAHVVVPGTRKTIGKTQGRHGNI